MNWNKSIRQVHRWLSILFTAVVGVIFAMLGMGKEPSQSVFLLPLIPLGLMWLSGMYLFVLPYAAKWRSARRAGAEERA